MSPKILFLNGRLPAYTVASMHTLVEVSEASLEVYFKPNNPDAPFAHQIHPAIGAFSRDKLDVNKVEMHIHHREYDLLVVSGWGDKSYNRLARVARRNGVPVVLMMDNPWQGTIKQQVATWLSTYLRSGFSHCWVPGVYQYEYARKLGFSRNNILFNLYSADVNRFSAGDLVKSHTGRFVFTGRLSEEKGLATLIEAVGKYRKRYANPWKVEVVGNGRMAQQLAGVEGIQVHPFMQPEELKNWAGQGGVFVLPSLYEPWGVVVHEYALMGYPLILSDAVGAGNSFLRHQANGLKFPAGDADSLASAMELMSSLDQTRLDQMGAISKTLAKSISNLGWVLALNQVVNLGLRTDHQQFTQV